VATSLLKSISFVFNFYISVVTSAEKEVSLDPTALVLPLTIEILPLFVEIFFSTLVISSGVATGLAISF